MKNISTRSSLIIISFLMLILGVFLSFLGLAFTMLLSPSYYLIGLSIPFYLFGKVIEAIKENTNVKIDIFNEGKDDLPVIIKKHVF